VDERRLSDDEIAELEKMALSHPTDWLFPPVRRATMTALLAEVRAARSVPASDPRALALEEAARAIENDPLVQCGAVMDGPHFAEIVRRLGSGSESPRDQGAPAVTHLWSWPSTTGYRSVCGVDLLKPVDDRCGGDVEPLGPAFASVRELATCPACLAGRPVETGSEGERHGE
jgi:hypothetical protein